MHFSIRSLGLSFALFTLFSSVYGFADAAEETVSRPYTATKNVRWSGYEVEYQAAAGTWHKAPGYFIAEKDDSHTNADGEEIEFVKGDLVFDVKGHGWYKAVPPSGGKKLSVPNPSHVMLSGEETEVVDLTNKHRADNSLKALTVSAKLMASARSWADQMVTTYGFTHMPGASENIGWNYMSARAVMDGWITSPGHNANLLAGYTHIGIGHVHPYWSQQFL